MQRKGGRRSQTENLSYILKSERRRSTTTKFHQNKHSEITTKVQISNNESFRELDTAFYFTMKEQKVRVCKHFLKATLDINDRPIGTCLEKLNNGVITQDGRGRHGIKKCSSLIQTIVPLTLQ